MSRFRADNRPVLVLAAFFLVQWLLLMAIVTPVWDAAFYYAYARSPIFDGDLALENDLLLSYPTAGEPFVNKQAHTILTGTGRVFSPYAIGSALVSIPLFAVSRLVLLPFNGLESGYEWPYLAVMASFSTLLGFLAFWLTYRMSAAFTNRKTALFAVVTLMFATPLIYYQFREPIYSHVASAFISAGVIYCWWQQVASGDLPKPAGALLLGGLLGLSVLIRWQHAVYAVLPLATVFLYFRYLAAGAWKVQWRPALIYLFLVGVAGALVISLQMAQWRLFNGSWFLVPQGDGFMEWQAPYLLDVLFSPFRGLLYWMPIFFPAGVGLVLLARQRPGVIWPLFLVLMLELYVNSSTQDWFGGGGFGPRKFTGEIIILGLGYAGFLGALGTRWRWWVGGVLGIFLVWHQWILLRYGLAEQFGGRVLSTYPFLAEADSPRQLMGQFVTHLPDLFTRPVDFLILPGSPLDLLLRYGLVPVQHLVGVVAAGIFLLVVWWIWRRSRAVWPWLIGGAILILLGNWWILTRA